MLKRHLTTLTLVVCSMTALSQDSTQVRLREFERTFQFSLFPGISTNGIMGGFYYNKFSLNLFGGLSAGNRFIEVGVISNLNLKASNGIQFAGLANVVGSNAFINLTLSEERKLIHDGFESNYQGIQVAGFLNYVRTNGKGLQISGGFNVTGFDFNGIAIAGFGNSAGINAVGLQLAGLYNYANEGMGGFQISSLFNYTNGQLAGVQLGLINKATRIHGRKSTPPTSNARGLQIGLLNFSKAMDGMQIGLINFGGSARGMQVGLINFFNKYGSKELVRMGTPIGLLNIGSRGSYFRLYYNELFSANIEYTTGNCMNCSYAPTEMPFLDNEKIYNQNSLIVGYDHWNKNWGFGWGFQKVSFNKVSVAPNPGNERRVITYGIRFMHLNRELSFDKAFNLLNRLNVDYGIRWRSKYVFAGLSLNYFVREKEDEKVYKVNSVEFLKGSISGMAASFWPGYAIGMHF